VWLCELLSQHNGSSDSQPDLFSPHALCGWSATLVVRVEALLPELSIPPQKKKKLKKLKNVNHASITHVML
jgi:hypothetical protein